MGVGVGVRAEDYVATGLDFHRRGALLDAHQVRRGQFGPALGHVPDARLAHLDLGGAGGPLAPPHVHLLHRTEVGGAERALAEDAGLVVGHVHDRRGGLGRGRRASIGKRRLREGGERLLDDGDGLPVFVDRQVLVRRVIQRAVTGPVRHDRALPHGTDHVHVARARLHHKAQLL